MTDDFDKRLLCTFTSVWFSEALLQPGFKFYEGYPLPDYKTIEEYIDHIINMPLQDIPEVFGLHSNADISYQVGILSQNESSHWLPYDTDLFEIALICRSTRRRVFLTQS